MAGSVGELQRGSNPLRRERQSDHLSRLYDGMAGAQADERNEWHKYHGYTNNNPDAKYSGFARFIGQ